MTGPKSAKPRAQSAKKDTPQQASGWKKMLDLSDVDLRKFDLTRKYDDDFNPSSWRDHVLLYGILSLVVVFLVWASLAQVEEVARGDGRVIPSSQIQVIQNLEGGIIDEFLVREGDVVKEGQVVARMSNIQAEADFGSTQQRYLGLLAATTRLRAEAEGKSSFTFPPEVIKGAPESVRAEQDAFRARQQQYQGQVDVLNQQLAQRRGEVAELNRRIQDTSSLLQLARDERAMVAPMVERGAANKMELLQIDRQIATQEAELNGLRAALPRANAAAREAQSRIEETKSTFRAEAQRSLAEKTSEMSAIRETLGAFQDRSRRTEVRSPVTGRVQEIKISTVGGVVRPGDPIMEVVPLEDRLVVEARIRPADIAFIYPGQRAVVRISAFDFSIYGAMEGVVKDVSPDSIINDKGESFYRVRIETPEPTLRRGKEAFEIKVGMQATVDIITGKKTVMNYLAKPFIKASRTALRER